MAKKKKHRKSNRSRKQRIQTSSTGKNHSAAQQSTVVDTEVIKTTVTTPTSRAKPSKEQITYDDVELSYVKEDVTKTLILIGVILAVYAVIWLLMSYTSFGTQLLHIFSR